MLEISRSQFESKKYSRIRLVKTCKNGNEIYEFDGICPKCGGRKVLTWTNVDNGICYQCEGSGFVVEKIKVLSDENYSIREQERKAKQQQALARYEEKKAQTRMENEKLGYKKVDFKVAGWFFNKSDDVAYNFDKYYLIIKETSKAVLINFIDTLEYTNINDMWFPKSAIIYNR